MHPEAHSSIELYPMTGARKRFAFMKMRWHSKCFIYLFGFVFFKRHLLLSKVLGRESWNLNEHQLHNIVNRAVGIGGTGGGGRFFVINFIAIFVQYLHIRYLELDFLGIFEGSNPEFFHLLHS